MKDNTFFNKSAGVLLTDELSSSYPFMSHQLYAEGDTVDSRNGLTKEFLNFMTKINHPRKRCIGGYYRDINIFFLLAEAMWIWTGKKDVEFLNIFNSKMKDYSDDGKSFHAPYGFRLRNYGVSSFEKPIGENKHAFQGIDQIEKAIKMLSEDGESRRVVLSIWDANLDLDTKTKDTPCNDLLMLKVRENKLYLTISNRSNDLHWGLPTNSFQFSFIGEVLSLILDLELCQQTHNSQSLHAYTGNPMTPKLAAEFLNSNNRKTIYDLVSESKMYFKFSNDNPILRLNEFDSTLNNIIETLTEYSRGNFGKPELFAVHGIINAKSVYFTLIFELLQVYIDYKKSTKTTDDKTDAISAIISIRRRYKEKCGCEDYIMLALNFFIARLPENEQSFMKEMIFTSEADKYLGKL